MVPLLLTNGRVIDPSQNLDRVTNVLIENGRIAGYDVAVNGYKTLDCSGKIVSPGLIDMHVELREPGGEEDETIATGTRAAIAGGFTSIACLPNTEPPLDTQAGIEFVRHKAERAGHCRVHVIACASKGREGKELSEMGSLSEAEAVAFSDAPRPIANPDLLRRALQYSRMFDKPILNHPETPELSQSGIMHEGKVSMVLGLAGMPAEAEDVMTARDIRLVEATGGKLHMTNISSSGSVEILRRVKARGVRVTAGVCAYHLALTDESLRTFDSAYKVNPPLRPADHVEACIAGLADGALDVIVSGHTPRASEKKLQELDQAPFGMIGLETTLSLVIMKLIDTGRLTWLQALSKLTTNPARILGLDAGTLKIGAPADITLIDPDHRWTVSPEALKSKSTNTPLLGMILKGRAAGVIVGGEIRA